MLLLVKSDIKWENVIQWGIYPTNYLTKLVVLILILYAKGIILHNNIPFICTKV
jgi:hypothetical protein